MKHHVIYIVMPDDSIKPVEKWAETIHEAKQRVYSENCHIQSDMSQYLIRNPRKDSS